MAPHAAETIVLASSEKIHAASASAYLIASIGEISGVVVKASVPAEATAPF